MGGSPSKPGTPTPVRPPQSPPKPHGKPGPVEEEQPKKPVEEKPKRSPGEQGKSYEEQPKEPVGPLKRFPHRYDDIIAQADTPSMGDLEVHMFSGIFLNQRRKKYWVDEKSGCNCFMLFARDLSITWSEDPRYWRWFSLQETRDICVEVAGLLTVCWLEIHGRFDISYLTPGTTYEVAFVVMMDFSSWGWNSPVTLRLTDPQGNEQKHLESLVDKPRGEWIELAVGEIKTTTVSTGEVEISLFEIKDGAWKNGLTVKGICIRPRTIGTRLIHLL